jgi:dTDP-glucose pyrophosphorylase
MGSQGSEYCGVILAAGRGERLRPLSFNSPKPLLPVGNVPIIQYQLEAMKSLGIREVVIVVGRLGHLLIDHYGNGERIGLHIRYVHQDKPLGIAHAVAQLEPYIETPFLLFLGDIFMVTRDLGRMITIFEERRCGGVLAVKREENPEFLKRNFTVLLHDDGRVRKVVEKPRFVTSTLKGCGIYLFDLPIFDAIRQTPRTAMRDEYEITTSIQIMINDGYAIYPAEVMEWDMNVTVPCDLLFCNLWQLQSTGQSALIGERTRLHPDARVENSVIGPDVVVEHPICIRDSLVLAGSVLTTRENVVGALVTPDTVISCRRRRG